MKRIFIIAALIGVDSYSVNAQARPRDGIWLALQLPVEVSKKFQWHNDVGYRTLGISSSALQYLFRTGIRYVPNKSWNYAAGIATFFSRTSFSKSNSEFGHEFRFWEEIASQQPLNKCAQLQFRFRSEQRSFAATSSKKEYTAYRFRIRAGINQTLSEKISLQLSDEYMRQLAGEKFSFDQNRLTGTVNFRFRKSSQLQTGLMWLRWPKDSQHIIIVTIIKNISLHAE